MSRYVSVQDDISAAEIDARFTAALASVKARRLFRLDTGWIIRSNALVEWMDRGPYPSVKEMRRCKPPAESFNNRPAGWVPARKVGRPVTNPNRTRLCACGRKKAVDATRCVGCRCGRKQRGNTMAGSPGESTGRVDLNQRSFSEGDEPLRMRERSESRSVRGVGE